ncbi:MAG: hypothetical protein LBG04_01960 [Holosporaceae bacterium]|jgi:hypothetical protein|nr:hypothetical protein [Holosporaceae bacterium]
MGWVIFFIVILAIFGVFQDTTTATPPNAYTDERAKYRTRDGNYDIEFLFKNCGAQGWRAYILGSPGYGQRSTDAHSTHRIYDSTLNLHYICWDRKVTCKSECKKVAALWSDKTIEYIRSGRRFG